MRRKQERQGTAFSLLLLGVVFAMTIPCASPALGSEPLGDLDLRLTLVGLETTTASDGSVAGGVARIEATLEAAAPAREARLRVLRPDGTAWLAGGRPFDPGPTAWTRADGGEALVAADGSVALGARETVRAVLEIPLEGAAVHEIVVEVAGRGARGSLRTENVLRVALGVPETDAEEDDEYVSFPVEVRP